jgi:MFS family permease
LEADRVPAPAASFLATRRGRLTLLCAVQFLDVADSSITNVALPSIRRDPGFSVHGRQWALSGYPVTYGGLLLGGRSRAGGRGRHSDDRVRRLRVRVLLPPATRLPHRN